MLFRSQENVSLLNSFFPHFSLKSLSCFFIAINIAVYLILVVIGYLLEIPYNCFLYYVGALYPPALVHFHIHRLILPAFFHFSPMHFLGNCLSGIILSFEPEFKLGKIGFLILYMGSSIYGFILSSILNPNVLTAGASAAILGLFGYFIVNITFNIYNMNTTKWTILIGLGCLNLYLLFSSNIANAMAHLGGLITGSLYTLVQIDKRINIPSIIRRIAMIILILYPIVCLVVFLILKLDFKSYC